MKKILKVSLLVLIAFIGVIGLFSVVTGKTYLFRAIYYNFSGIDDYKIFENRSVESTDEQAWIVASPEERLIAPDSLIQQLEELKTVACVVIKDGKLVYENYWDGYSDSSLSGSFSVAKSIVSLLIGAAIKDGAIGSVEDSVVRYLPELPTELAAMRIKDLLTMSSGSDFQESYSNPISITSEMYYGNDLLKTAFQIKKEAAPGTLHRYKSGDTQLLGFIVERATGETLSAYASKKLWKPLGAKHSALWSLDKKGGHEKAYCCFNTNARDFARIGQMMLDSGRWNGTAIIERDYYSASITPCNLTDEEGKQCNYYGYQWWIHPKYPEVFYARGILGQYIIVIPSTKTVIVRLGHKRSSVKVDGVPTEVTSLIHWGLANK